MKLVDDKISIWKVNAITNLKQLSWNMESLNVCGFSRKLFGLLDAGSARLAFSHVFKCG